MPSNGVSFLSVSLQSQQQGLLPLQVEPAAPSAERGARRTEWMRPRTASRGSTASLVAPQDSLSWRDPHT